jgi:hypothetical protein
MSFFFATHLIIHFSSLAVARKRFVSGKVLGIVLVMYYIASAFVGILVLLMFFQNCDKVSIK